MRPEAAFRPAPEIVGQPDRGDRCDGRHGEPDHPADERQPEPAEADGLRPTGEHELGELAAAMGEPAQIATRRPMLELELDLLHREPGPDGVDRHPRLDAEAHRDRENGGARPCREQTLAREGLAHLTAAPNADQRAGRALRETEAATLAHAEHGDCDIRTGRGEPAQVAAKIRVAQEQRPLLELLLGKRQRLALAAAVEPDHPGAGRLGNGRGAVARAVVGDHDRRSREVRPQHRDGLTDPFFLVAGGDEDAEAVAHPDDGAGGIVGNTPSTASLPTP